MIPDGPTLALFCLASFTLAFVPGPAVVYIVARSIDQGRAAGIVSALGIATGGLVHVAAATIGLSSLLVSSALAFEVVKYLGAAYLIFLGIRRFLERDEQVAGVERVPRPRRELFRQGVVVNVLNPKTAVFFFAFLPQFVDVSAGRVGLQIGLLGLVFIIIALASDSMYALVAGTLGGWLRESRGYLRAQRIVTGTVLVILGLTTALTGSKARVSTG